MRENRILMALISGLAIISMSYFFLMDEESNEGPVTENESRNIAKELLKDSPTFKFDGFDLEYKETLYPEIMDHPNLYTFVFEFRSRHGGYGDRTGEQLLEVITPHEAHVSVENGEVVKAVLDLKWDMLNQKLLEKVD